MGSPTRTPQDRPDWLPPEVWPFPLCSMETEAGRVSITDVGEGPALLFCHAGMWSFVWRDVIAELSATYRCITFDPLGSGLSERTIRRPTLAGVRDTITTIVTTLELDDMTLVLHDLGGPTALAAVASMPARVSGIAAVNTFGWRPSGVAFRGMLALFGSSWMRELDAVTAWLPWASTSRFGIGRHLDRASRRAFRRGMDRTGRRTMHRLFHSARGSGPVFAEAARAVDVLAARPLLTVFGQFGDHLRFRPRWRSRFADVTEVEVPRGLHFPMSDAPALTARAIDTWHRGRVAPSTSSHPRGTPSEHAR